MCFPFLHSGSKRVSLTESLNVFIVPSSAKDSKAARRELLYRDLIDHTHLISSTISSIADGPLNIPGLKNAADLVTKLAAIGQVSVTIMKGVCADLDHLTPLLHLNESQSVQANKDDCDKLVKQAADYLSIITDALDDGGNKVQIHNAFRGQIISFVE